MRKWTFSEADERNIGNQDDSKKWFTFKSSTYYRDYHEDPYTNSGRRRRQIEDNDDFERLIIQIEDEASDQFEQDLIIGDDAEVLETERSEPIIVIIDQKIPERVEDESDSTGNDNKY
jgi:hypothetical protein